MNGAKRPFLDTNIVIYLMSEDAGKATIAENLIAQGGVVSVQVLNEFVSVARRKLRLSWVEIREVLGAVRANLEVVPVTLSVHERALDIAAAHGLNIYDAAIVSAAMDSGCDALVSEDMQDGRRFEALSVSNPFR